MCLGIPGRVTSRGTDPIMPMGTIDVAGEERACCFAYLPEIEIGQWVLFQNGFAMTSISEQEAHQAMQTMSDYGLLE